MTEIGRDGAAGAIVLAGPPAPSRRGGVAFDPAWARVAGRLAWTWPVDALANSPDIGSVVLVVETRRIAAARRQIAAADWCAVRAVAPAEGDGDVPGLVGWLGAGLAALADDAGDTPNAIVLHEGTRPLLPTVLLDALIAAWDGASVVVAASPMKETLKAVDGHRCVRQTPPRDRLWQLRPPLLAPRPVVERILVTALPTSEDDQASGGIGGLIARTPGLRLRLVAAGHEEGLVRRRADVALVAGMLQRSTAT